MNFVTADSGVPVVTLPTVTMPEVKIPDLTVDGVKVCPSVLLADLTVDILIFQNAIFGTTDAGQTGATTVASMVGELANGCDLTFIIRSHLRSPTVTLDSASGTCSCPV